jgi:hypothetical protein
MKDQRVWRNRLGRLVMYGPDGKLCEAIDVTMWDDAEPKYIPGLPEAEDPSPE